jgi:hypothetical protein
MFGRATSDETQNFDFVAVVEIPRREIAAVQDFEVDLDRDLFRTKVEPVEEMGNRKRFFRLVLFSIHDNFHKYISEENAL